MMNKAALFLTLIVHVVHAKPLRAHQTRGDDDANTAAFYQLVKKVDLLEAKLQATQTQVTDLQSQLDLEKQKTQQLQDENKRTVVFSAEMPPDVVQASAGSIIPFSHVVVNVGNGFDPVTSVFTAPFDGAYMFFVYADISTDYRAFHIHKGGMSVAACDNDSGMRRLSCGLTLNLKTGDTVTLVHFGSNGSIGAGGASAFSGFRIH